MAHYRLSYFVVALICTIGLFISCEEAENEEEISNQYLESDEYKDFAENSRKEAEHNPTKRQDLKKRLELLSECSGSNEILSSVTMDETEIERLIATRSDECQVLDPEVSSDAILKPVGMIPDNTLDIWLILVEHPTVYKNNELLVATLNAGELIDIKVIGNYQENLSRQVSTQLQIERNDILRLVTVAHRIISYPVEQENSIKRHFLVQNDGIIVEEDS